MYTAINKYVIATKVDNETISGSGIISSGGEPRYKVVATTEESKDLQDKVVIGVANKIDNGFYYIDYTQIFAVVS
jgi:hypothetical protein